MKNYKINHMTERKYVADKRVLAYNPFQRIDDDLFEFMDGYTFLDFLKLHRGYVNSFTQTIHRPTDTIYSMCQEAPIAIMSREYEDVELDLKICLRKPERYT